MTTKTTNEARRKFFASLYPRERWTPDEWAENCRVLSSEESSDPGPYRLDRTPFWRDPLKMAADATVEEIVCLKGAQIGWSEYCRNWLGYTIDLDPGPTMILMPDQKSAEDFRDERIEPLIQHTDAVRRHVSGRAWDSTKHRIKFDSMSVFFVWAGSKSGTKSRPIKNLICEEPDEYPAFSSTGGDPLSKAEKRLTTYRDKGRAKLLIGGTPTTRTGNVWKRWEMCPTKYHYWVPCPHCNGYQLLLWKQVKWPELKDIPDRAKRAAKIETEGLAFYECEHCKKEIHDHDKPRMLRRGLWATEDQVVTLDGRVAGPKPTGKRVGYKLSGLYSPWVPFATLAKEWIESQGDQQSLADFINQRLAEPFEEQRAKTEPDLIREKVQQRFGDDWQPAPGSPDPMIVPSWARLLIATADTQGTNDQDGYFWYVIRAWGYDFRSQLVDFGVASSRDELRERCLNRQIPINGGGMAAPQILLVDSGGPRFGEVYQMAQADNRIHPTKGSSGTTHYMVQEKLQRNHNVVLWMIDTEQSKDQLFRLIHDPDRTKWMPHNGINADYCSQICAESKIFDPKLGRETWIEIVKNNNHLLDCEQQQCAAAWRLGAGAPEPPVAATSESKPTESPLNYGGRW